MKSNFKILISSLIGLLITILAIVQGNLIVQTVVPMSILLLLMLNLGVFIVIKWLWQSIKPIFQKKPFKLTWQSIVAWFAIIVILTVIVECIVMALSLALWAN